ncbi:hypothetical protein VTG60DRAFT_1616 [Thermothelomyces hinnuleus]
MPISLRLEPADSAVPPGSAVIYVKIDREALRHLDPSMNLLSDADSSSTVLRKGKGALEYVRRQLSDMLFGDDIARSVILSIYPHPDFAVTSDSEPLLKSKYISFYWKRHIVAREPSIALVELTSESQPVDNYLGFHAVEVVDEEYKAAVLQDTFASEARMEAAEAEAQAQTQA